MRYDYRCSSCEHTFEEILKMDDREKPTKEPCPECGAEGTVSQVLLSTPPLLDPFNAGRIKVDADFRNKLEGIKKVYKADGMNPHGFER
jgi:putative FmdB family regulatory protein